MPTVTVTRKSKGGRADAMSAARYTLTFSQLPGEVFGPWSYREATQDLLVSALITPIEARNLVLDAYVSGSATRETG